MPKFKMSWVSPKIISKNSKKEGKGVFAIKPIRKEEPLVVFGGYVMNRKEMQKLSPDLQHFPYHITDSLLFGPIQKKDVSAGEMFNHSCNPNLGFDGNIILVAIRNISKGEELCFDYATCMTSNLLNFKCQCGEKKCRKRITGDDWKIPALQKRLKRYFQPYIINKINKKLKK